MGISSVSVGSSSSAVALSCVRQASERRPMPLFSRCPAEARTRPGRGLVCPSVPVPYLPPLGTSWVLLLRNFASVCPNDFFFQLAAVVFIWYGNFGRRIFDIAPSSIPKHGNDLADGNGDALAGFC